MRMLQLFLVDFFVATPDGAVCDDGSYYDTYVAAKDLEDVVARIRGEYGERCMGFHKIHKVGNVRVY